MSEERELMVVESGGDGRGRAITGMVLGIVAVVLAHMPFLCILGLALSIPAVVIGGKVRRHGSPRLRGFAVAALITGWIALGVSIFMCAYTGIMVYIVGQSAWGWTSVTMPNRI